MTITLRLEKGEELTWEELDENFQELVAALNERVQSITINGGEPVVPDEDGNVEITIESGAFTEVAGRNIVANLYGTVNSGALDSFCMGTNSSVGGRSNTIVNSWASSIESGFGSSILGGSGSKITGNTYYSVILGGYQNTLASNESLIMGTMNSIKTETINDRNNIAFGRWGDIVAGNAVMTQGIGLKARGTAHLVVGQANEFISHGSNNINVSDAPRFIVGNGTITGTFQASTRSNAFVVYQNGSVIAPSLTPALIDADTTGKMLITKEYLAANSGSGGGGESAFRIELDTNSNKNYISAQSTNGNILTNGSDNLIISNDSTIDGGSSRNIIVGNGSVNESYQNILCGWGLTANSAFFNLIGGTDNLINEGDSNLIIGHNNEALGDIWYSVVGGQLNEINGYVQSSIIMGEGCIVSDTYQSLVLGGAHEIGTGYESIFVGNGIIETEDRTANGGRNVGFGYGHEISGGYNAAIGYWHKLQDYFTTAVGISATTDGLISPRFLVGIGDVDNSYPYVHSPKNGFIVLQSGEVIAPELTSALIDGSTNERVMLTKEYVEANYIKKPTGVYEDNASALAGGLSVDDTYRTADGTIKIVF